MAKRRMFSTEITDSDAFLTMPMSTQCLYFHLNMKGDDDGFVNSPKSIMRTIGASEDDMKILIMKKFIIPFESGIVVIKHWRIHNYIRGDRKKETTYLDERKMLAEKENGSYTLCQPNDNQMSGICQSNVSVGKDSIGKDSIGKSNKGKRTPKPPKSFEEVLAYAKEQGYEHEAIRFYNFYEAGNWYKGSGQPVLSWKQQFLTWISYRDKPQQKSVQSEIEKAKTLKISDEELKYYE